MGVKNRSNYNKQVAQAKKEKAQGLTDLQKLDADTGRVKYKATIFLFDDNVTTIKTLSLCPKYHGEYQPLVRDLVDAALKDDKILAKLGLKNV